MASLYFLIPITLVLLGVAVLAWIWCVRAGQFDDLDREASRILFDDFEVGGSELDSPELDSREKKNNETLVAVVEHNVPQQPVVTTAVKRQE